MDTNERDLEIQKYLQGDFSAEELARFVEKQAKDPDLAQAVKDYESLETGLEAVGLDKFKAEVSEWEQEHLNRSEDTVKTEPRGKVVSFKKYMPLAASVALLLVAGIYFYNSRTVSSDTLYAQYYEPYPDLVTKRGDSTSVGSDKNLLLAGIEAYNNKNFALAVTSLQNYLQAKPQEKGVALYLAISLMELNQFDEATSNFKKAQEDPIFKQQALWYEALLNLKAGNLEKSRSLLSVISNDQQNYRQQQATKLLNSL